MNSIETPPRDVVIPTRGEIQARIAASPPLEQLLTADDLERQQLIARETLKPAAVLLLVVNHPGEPAVVFTQRTAHLADHAGQVSLPAGRRDADERTAERTA